MFSRGFDYWESGMDLYSTEDMYDSFRRYQTALLEQFDQLAEEFHFQVIDARPEPAEIFEQLRAGIQRIVGNPEAARPSLVVAPVCDVRRASGETLAADREIDDDDADPDADPDAEPLKKA